MEAIRDPFWTASPDGRLDSLGKHWGEYADLWFDGARIDV
jgi:hypothetical protein